MIKGLKKVFAKGNQKKIFEKYQVINSDIMQIVQDIEDLKRTDLGNISRELEALENAKKDLESELIDLEENFYDVKKGLWIGIARDLNSEDYRPILLYFEWKNIYNHFDVYGTSGYGKSRLMALMIRQFIKFGWSLMAIDPKGGEKQEVAQWVYDFAAEAGRNPEVMRIMPTYADISDKGNILFGLDDDEIASMAASLTVSGSGALSTDEQFFSGQVYRITMAILTATRFLEKVSFSKEEINKMIEKEVQKYLDFKNYRNKDVVYEDENLAYPDPATVALSEVIEQKEVKYMISPFNRTLITFRELAYFSNFLRLQELHKIVKSYPLPETNNPRKNNELKELKKIALTSLDDVTSMEKTFFEKTGSSLSVLLSQLAYGSVGKILCDIRINPIVQRIRDKEGTIIIFQPAPMRFEKVSEMLIKCYTRMFLSLFGTIGASGRGIHRRVALVVDEAKPMMFPGIEELYNKARQLGMTIGAFYQSISDIKFKLGDTLTDITRDNTATFICMKQVSTSSMTEAAESFATKKVSVNVNMREQGSSGGRSTVIFEDRELVSPDDIDSLGIGEGFVKHFGKKYYVVFPYQKDPMPINVVMPKLDSETLYEDVMNIENRLKSLQTVIDDYDNEMKVA